MRTRTLCVVKPDAVEQGLVGVVLATAERVGLRLVSLGVARPPRAFWEAFYAEHRGKSFFASLVEFMGGPPGVVFAVLEAGDKHLLAPSDHAVAAWRWCLGVSDSRFAAPGTLRGLYGDKTGQAIWRNVAHGSDSAEAAVREIALAFKPTVVVHPLRWYEEQVAEVERRKAKGEQAMLCPAVKNPPDIVVGRR